MPHGQVDAQIYLSVLGFPPGIPADLQLPWEPLTVSNSERLEVRNEVRKHPYVRESVDVQSNVFFPTTARLCSLRSPRRLTGTPPFATWPLGAFTPGGAVEASRSGPKR